MKILLSISAYLLPLLEFSPTKFSSDLLEKTPTKATKGENIFLPHVEHLLSQTQRLLIHHSHRKILQIPLLHSENQNFTH